MPLTGNKGEWSEIYTLFKLLGDGVVYAGNGDMDERQLNGRGYISHDGCGWQKVEEESNCDLCLKVYTNGR